MSTRILIIDDEISFCEAASKGIREKLPKQQVFIEIATGWKESIKKYNTLSPNYVIVDYDLKGCKGNGLELINYLKRNNTNSSWYLVSACEKKELNYALINTGIEFWRKPLDDAWFCSFSGKIKKDKENYLKLPFFLSRPIQDYNDSSTDGCKKFEIALKLIEVFTTYLTAVMAHHTNFGTAHLLDHFDQKFVSLKGKIDLLAILVKSDLKEEYLNNKLIEKFRSKDLISCLYKLNELRNKIASHGPMYSQAPWYLDKLDKVNFKEVINIINDLSFIKMFVVNDSSYTGNGYLYKIEDLTNMQERYEFLSPSPLKSSKEYSDIYISAINGKIYSLSPFFKYAYCRHCNKFQCFWFHNKNNKEVEYFDIACHDLSL